MAKKYSKSKSSQSGSKASKKRKASSKKRKAAEMLNLIRQRSDSTDSHRR